MKGDNVLKLLDLRHVGSKWTWRAGAQDAQFKSFSLAAVVKETSLWVMPIYKQKYAGTLPPVRGNAVVYGRRMERKVHFSSPSPLFVRSLHYTTGNTCNASRRDFWQRGGGNNFRKHAPFTFPLFLPPSRLSQWLGALMSAIDLVAGDNSFHRCDTPWWTGAPRTPRLIPSPAFQQASVGEAACRTHGGSIDLPRLDSQRDADAVLFCRLLYFRGPRHTAATICHHVWDRDSVWIKCVSSCVGCDI